MRAPKRELTTGVVSVMAIMEGEGSTMAIMKVCLCAVARCL